MANTIDMQGMRYINLFSKITRVNTRYFFKYNDMLVFGVPKPLLSKSLGKNSENLRKISGILKKRIRVVPLPRGIEDAEKFIKAIISPLDFKEIEIKDDEIIVTAGGANKAALLGRNKRRLSEMQEIVRNFFKKNFRII
ncbi:hypothetical protein B6U91_00200 [Candidatus Pacearchaeota archaeon ex4484_71]|nr:MAG: hypothetical protein B6U91_00200 [Candidatus Pacearchaeota archaeon ex4484_71]